jgi:hypothetical protein
MIGRTYSILRSSRQNQKTVETVVDTGMSWEAADSKRNKRDAAERKAHPEKSSWTRDLFIVRMEELEAVNPTPAVAHI